MFTNVWVRGIDSATVAAAGYASHRAPRCEVRFAGVTISVVDVPVCVCVSVAAAATTGVVSNTLSPRKYCAEVPPSASFAVVTLEFVGVRLSDRRASVVTTAVPAIADVAKPPATIEASTTEPAVGVLVSDRRESVVMTAVPVIADVAKPPAAIFAVVTVPSVGVRVSDSRESLPAAADVAVVPNVRALPVAAAASVATVNVTSPVAELAAIAPDVAIDETPAEPPPEAAADVPPRTVIVRPESDTAIAELSRIKMSLILLPPDGT